MQVRKWCTILVLMLSMVLGSEAQIISLYKQLDSVKSIKDSSISLKYFRKPDAEIQNYLDSFFIYLSIQRGIKLDSNFYCQVDFTKGYYVNRIYHDKPEIVITYRNDYASYRYFTEVDTAHKNRCVFAFSFYKEKLVIFSINPAHQTAKKRRIITAASDFNLVNNLIYEQMSLAVKKQIDTKPSSFEVDARPPLREYHLKE